MPTTIPFNLRSFLASLVLAFCATAVAQVAYPVTIEHELGETIVQAEPVRIVTLSEEMAELVAVLDEAPVGHAARRPVGADIGAAMDLSTPLADALSGATYVGLVGEPSLEAIAQLRPDLIIAYTNEGSFVASGGYDQLSAIAPTLAFSFEADGEISWYEPLRTVATALDRQAEADAYIAGFEAQLDELQTAFAPIVADTPRMSFFFWPNPSVNFVLGPNHYFAPILQRLGFEIVVPEGVELRNGVSAPVSLEVFASIDTDVIMALRLTPEPGAEPQPVPAEELVLEAGFPYVAYPLPPLEGQAGPITDLERARKLLELMR